MCIRDRSYTLARILLLFNHRVNIIRQESDANICKLNELGVNIIYGIGSEINVLSRHCVSESDVFIVLMDNDMDNLVSCLYIKNNFSNKKTITKVSNPKYVKCFEQVGIDIAINSALMALNSISEIRKSNESF
jgi:Trk K+ transport system NAD-binding subunit